MTPDQPQVDNFYAALAEATREAEFVQDEPIECWPPCWSEVLGILAGGGLDDVE